MQFRQFPSVNWPSSSAILNIVELNTSVCVLLLDPQPFVLRQLEYNKRETGSQANNPSVIPADMRRMNLEVYFTLSPQNFRLSDQSVIIPGEEEWTCFWEPLLFVCAWLRLQSPHFQL